MDDNKPAEDVSDEPRLMEKRIRHITAIQIRNLTPFPARDSFASALTQPAEQSQFTSHGRLSDDLDVAMQRKRSRRISTNSVATHRSKRSDDGLRDDGLPTGSIAERGRKTSGPRLHGLFFHFAYFWPAAVSIIVPWGSASGVASSLSMISPDNSQAGLEKVIHSRLVETFLAITIPQSMSQPDTSTHHAPQPTSPLKSSTLREKPSSPKVAESHSARKVVKPPAPSSADKPVTKARRDSASSPRFPPKASPAHTKSASVSVLRPNGEAKRPIPQSASAPAVQIPPPKADPPIPNYFSPIHRPSTHPYFPIDTRSCDGFIEGTDCSGHKLKVEVWGRVASRWKELSISGKGKEKAVVTSEDTGAEWKILEEWDVDLRDLVTMSDTSAPDASQLPYNSLLITLSPPGETFYLPPCPPSPRRPLSPSEGYASDPETEVRRIKQTDIPPPPATAPLASQSDDVVVISRRRHRRGAGMTSRSSLPPAKTAGWQDLFKFVTLQSCIWDTERSLSDVVRAIDKVVSDTTVTMRREVSEREARLEELAASHKKMVEDTERLRSQIQSRRAGLEKRKQLLQSAQEQLQEAVESEFEMEESVTEERTRHSSLRARFGPTRTTLFSILSSIYPIELRSPPDLLYTILDVPLPIPLSSGDPAPPLTLPSHKDVNEDAVATSLGYAAHVVQLLAAYLGKDLVYPVTCIGSRSLIRDNISAMVGPRMFPLYSKGVDTYRFEYGVFLLNKDIELLMADRDLRALDMRHTLPNIKNLLLTLTDGEGARLHRSQPPDSPLSLASDLRSTSRPDSPVDPNSTTPKASDPSGQDGNTTPPASGSTTPTAASTDASKKARPFLGFSPLSGFLRGRYPSASRASVKSCPSTADEGQESEERQETSPTRPSSEQDQQDGDSDEDRRTISNVSPGRSAGAGKEVDPVPPVNAEKEKREESPSTAHTTSPPPFTTVR
ncbi:putative vacuolar sorting 38 and autophagy-related subunit 14 [Lyophyllum shimeji]|uniref:Autophagy-related protein 14 n=1 Tax=Lyophyllum shimeji TaxID=47721 RepID=A0A9P3UKD7_LYOSH|nr:putative vacuolar sorting 38 and autophagy-related subunit 14 [Lyophyllum shimeji]